MSRLIRYAWALSARIDSERWRRRLTLTLGHQSSLAQEIPLFRSFPPFPLGNDELLLATRPFDRLALNTNDHHFLPLVDTFRRRRSLNFNSPYRSNIRIFSLLFILNAHNSIAFRHISRVFQKFLKSISTGSRQCAMSTNKIQVFNLFYIRRIY